MILTGAGVSAASNIPTFRDPSDGIWTRYDPAQCATLAGFRQNPEKLWELIRDLEYVWDCVTLRLRIVCGRMLRVLVVYGFRMFVWLRQH